MAQKREKEETELKVPENLLIRNPPAAIAAPSLPILPPPESADLKISSTVSLGASCSRKTENRGVLKRSREATRCSWSGCRKRVGLIGFRCRCGDVFCSEHRYSDRHDCSFDYKAAGREAIARENPVVKAAKLFKV